MKASSPLQIMLVDDDPLVRFHLRLLLQSVQNASVSYEAEDVPQAIEILERHLPQVLVLDLQMPSGSGLDVLRHVRARQHPCTIIVLSGIMDPDMASLCIRAGADHCLDKTTQFEQLRQLVSRLLDPAAPGATPDGQACPSA